MSNASGQIKNFDDLKNKIMEFSNITDQEFTTAKIIIIPDTLGAKECQMMIEVGDSCIVIETGNNKVADAFIELDEIKENVINEFSYNDFTNYYTSNQKWKDAVDKIIKKRNFKWTVLPDSVVTDNKSLGITWDYQVSNSDPNWGDKENIIWKQEADQIVKAQGVADIAEFRNNSYYWSIEDENSGSVTEYQLYQESSHSNQHGDYTVHFVAKLKTIKFNKSSLKTGATKVSLSYDLQETISRWYKTLRTIALVGLLSVLVYVGIRIIISSTGQEKAKYKKMIGDWLAAICILFVLHYIMAITMTMVESISKVFVTKNIIGTMQEDVLMSTIRGKVNTSDKISSSFTELIMYLALVIYTVVFTIHYLKRLIYLAFFTMIAPLIALTYPLDKIKDGQAQAFNLWLREYIFNALIPVIHLLIYSIFVGTAAGFASEHPVYALVCMGFMIPAEKFIRKMFGFEKASSVSQVGAAAGGAMVMNAINNIKKGGSGDSKSGGSGGGSGGGSSKQRTADSGYVSAPEKPTTPLKPRKAKKSGTTALPPTTGSIGDKMGITTGAPKPVGSAKSNFAGIKGVAGKYINKPNFKKAGKWAGRKFRRVAAGAAGAATLLPFAAAAALTNPEKAAQYLGAAGLAGYAMGNKVGNKLTNVEKQNRETFKENKWGTDEYNIRNTIKELEDNPEFIKTAKTIEKETGVKRKDLVRQYMANGVTDPNKILHAMNTQRRLNDMEDADRKSILKTKRKVTNDEMIAAQQLSQKYSSSFWTNPDNQTKIKGILSSQYGLNPNQQERAIALVSQLKGDLS